MPEPSSTPSQTPTVLPSESPIATPVPAQTPAAAPPPDNAEPSLVDRLGAKLPLVVGGLVAVLVLLGGLVLARRRRRRAGERPVPSAGRTPARAGVGASTPPIGQEALGEPELWPPAAELPVGVPPLGWDPEPSAGPRADPELPVEPPPDPAPYPGLPPAVPEGPPTNGFAPAGDFEWGDPPRIDGAATNGYAPPGPEAPEPVAWAQSRDELEPDDGFAATGWARAEPEQPGWTQPAALEPPVEAEPLTRAEPEGPEPPGKVFGLPAGVEPPLEAEPVAWDQPAAQEPVAGGFGSAGEPPAGPERPAGRPEGVEPPAEAEPLAWDQPASQQPVADRFAPAGPPPTEPRAPAWTEPGIEPPAEVEPVAWVEPGGPEAPADGFVVTGPSPEEASASAGHVPSPGEETPGAALPALPPANLDAAAWAELPEDGFVVGGPPPAWTSTQTPVEGFGPGDPPAAAAEPESPGLPARSAEPPPGAHRPDEVSPPDPGPPAGPAAATPTGQPQDPYSLGGSEAPQPPPPGGPVPEVDWLQDATAEPVPPGGLPGVIGARPAPPAAQDDGFRVQHQVGGGAQLRLPQAGGGEGGALRAFIDAWTGKAGASESMDLFQHYNRDVVGAPPVHGKPVDLPMNSSGQHYVWVPDTPYQAPAPGDVVVWGTGASGQAGSRDGHVAIFVRGDATGFDAFETNGHDPTPRVRHHDDYEGVLGWLHPRIRQGAGLRG